MSRVDRVTLPPPVLDLVEVYDDVVGDRDRFLWKWVYSLFPAFTLSSVPDEHAATVRVQKTVLTVLVTLLDDVAEKHGDVRTFEAIRRVVAGRGDPVGGPGVDAPVVAFAERVWSTFESTLEAAPRHDAFRELFDYDFRQSVNAMDYSRLLNDHLPMANLAGVAHYGPHNMVMFPYADVDLMYSPAFVSADLGVLREVTWNLQQLARIGNWLTTWEREIGEGDFTAGIVVYALRTGVVTIDEIEAAGPRRRDALVERIRDHGVEDRFMDAWWRQYRAVQRREYQAVSVDLDAFVRGMETVLAYHLASEGRK